jgi:hypothetical protein
VSNRAYRIFLREPFAFLVTLSLVFIAALCLIAFIDKEDNSRFVLLFPAVITFALAYLGHKLSLSWIQISEDGKEIVSVPSWYSGLWGERQIIGRIAAESELLFCHRSSYGASDGYYVVLRTPHAADVVLWRAATDISRRSWEKISKDIRERYRLNARLIRQAVSDQGIKETEWTRDSDKLRRKSIWWIVGPPLFGWLGVPARLFTVNPWTILVIGAVLWTVGFLMYWTFYRTHEVAKDQSLAVTTLVWSMQFVGFYAVTALATNAFLHR